MTFNFSKQWLTVYSVLDSQKSLKSTSQATTYIQSWRTFENLSGLAQKFNDLSRKLMEFKDFSRTFLKIQGLFKTVWTLCKVREEIWQWPTLNVHVRFYFYCFLFSNVADVWQEPDSKSRVGFTKWSRELFLFLS